MSPYEMDILEVMQWHERAIKRYKLMNGIK